jgi:hypothetical protein
LRFGFANDEKGNLRENRARHLFTPLSVIGEFSLSR